MRPDDKKYGYSGKVSFKNTKALTDAGLKLDRPFRAGWDYNQDGGYASAIDLEYNGKVFKAPTFGEAFDFLRGKGVVVTMIPCLTYALKDHIGYHYSITVFDEKEGRLKVEDDTEFGSFNLEAEAAIEKAIRYIRN